MRFVKLDLGADLRQLQRRMDKLLSEIMEASQPMMQLSGSGWHPTADVFETKANVVIVLEVPGIDINRLQVLLHSDIIQVSGHRQLPSVGCARHHQIEIDTGPFERALRLPCEVDADRVEASYKDGLLSIVCPKTERVSVQVDLQQEAEG